MSVETFDYVVVGAGSAGCVVASRLSEDPSVSVCLLEAGSRDTSTLVHMPLGFAAMLPTKINNWAFETVPQPGLNGRRGYQPRGKTLGGSSSINAMVYIRGHRWDYDHWASLGNTGWSYDEVLPYFKRAENNETIHNEFHGTGGPLNVAEVRTPNPFEEVFLQAGQQAGFPVNKDFNGADQEGVGVYQVTQKNGERCSAAKGYLTPNLSRPNLKVLTDAPTTRVVFEGRRAVGIEYRQGGQSKQVRARREVVLSAGAFQTPQILMLSGVGNADMLRGNGIAVVHELDGVGRNLQDHIDFTFSYKSGSKELIGISLPGTARMIKALNDYRSERRGMLTSNVAEAGGFLRTSPDLPAPDIQLHFGIGMVDNHGRKLHSGHGYSCHVCLLRPKSIGYVGLQSNDPLAPPVIDPNFFGNEEDLEVMVKGFKITRRILEAQAFAPFRGKELYNAKVRSDDEIRMALRERSDTVYHPIGTCKMGVDDKAVVDPELRVRGIEGLRVADASVMPTLIGGNTNAPSIMIGEKASDLIRAAHR